MDTNLLAWVNEREYNWFRDSMHSVLMKPLLFIYPLLLSKFNRRYLQWNQTLALRQQHASTYLWCKVNLLGVYNALVRNDWFHLYIIVIFVFLFFLWQVRSAQMPHWTFIGQMCSTFARMYFLLLRMSSNISPFTNCPDLNPHIKICEIATFIFNISVFFPSVKAFICYE